MKRRCNLSKVAKELKMGTTNLKTLIRLGKVEFMEEDVFINSVGNEQHRYYIDEVAFNNYLREVKNYD